jgi:hypothetical protein
MPLRSRHPGIAAPDTDDSPDDRAKVPLPDETCDPIVGDSGMRSSSLTLGRVQHLAKYRPDLVIITLGTNDAFAKPSHRHVPQKVL